MTDATATYCIQSDSHTVQLTDVGIIIAVTISSATITNFTFQSVKRFGHQCDTGLKLSTINTVTLALACVNQPIFCKLTCFLSPPNFSQGSNIRASRRPLHCQRSISARIKCPYQYSPNSFTATRLKLNDSSNYSA